MSEPVSNRPPIATAPLSVILRAGPPSDEVDAALARWRKYLCTLERPFEILLLREHPVERVVLPAVDPTGVVREYPHDRVGGVGPALQEALRAARYPLIATCLCDGQYQPHDLNRLLGAIDHVDVVTGFRVWRPVPWWRRSLDAVQSLLARVALGVGLEPRRGWLGSLGWRRRLLARWVFGLRLIDPECPFRLYRRAVFRNIPLQSRGPFVDVEILAKANHLAFLLTEEPVSWVPPETVVPEVPPFRVEASALFRHADFSPVGEFAEAGGPRAPQD